MVKIELEVKGEGEGEVELEIEEVEEVVKTEEIEYIEEGLLQELKEEVEDVKVDGDLAEVLQQLKEEADNLNKKAIEAIANRRLFTVKVDYFSKLAEELTEEAFNAEFMSYRLHSIHRKAPLITLYLECKELHSKKLNKDEL